MGHADGHGRDDRQIDGGQPHHRCARVLARPVAGGHDQDVVPGSGEVLDDPPHRVRHAVDHGQEAFRDDRYAHAASLGPPPIHRAAPR